MIWKPGDKVRCISKGTNGLLIKTGVIYTVRSCKADHVHAIVTLKEIYEINPNHGYHKRRFEYVPPPIIQMDEGLFDL